MRMRLLHLKLENIASYGRVDNELDFGDLAYPLFVSGPNGAGKTTFFVDGITFALFSGAYGRGPRGRDSSKKLITPAGRKLSGYVDLTFSAGNDLYRIIRMEKQMGKNRVWENTLFIQRNGRWVKEGFGEEVDEKIKSIIGFDYNTFLNSVVIRQGEVFSFIEKKDYERRNLLLKLLNIELDKYRDAIKKKMDEIEKRMKELQGRLSQARSMLKYDSIEDIREKRKELKKELKAVNKEIKKLEKEKKELDKEKSELERDIGALEKARKKLVEISQEIEKTENEIRSRGYLGKPDEIPLIEEKIREINNLKTSIETMEKRRKELEKIIKDFEDLKKRREEKTREEEKLRKLLEEIGKGSIEEVDKELNKLIGEKGGLNQKLESLRESLGILKTTKEPKCPVCGRDLDDEHRRDLIERMEKEIREVNIELKSLEERINVMRKLLRDIRKKKEEISSIKTIIDHLANTLEEYKEEDIVNEKEDIDRKLKEANLEVTEIFGEISQFFGFKCDIHTLEVILRVIGECKKLFGKLDMLKGEEEKLKAEIDMNAYKELTGKLEKLKERITKLEEKRDKLTTDSVNLKRDLDELGEQEKLFKEVKRLKEELAKMEKTQKIWRLLDSYVFAESMFPRSLLKSIVEDLLTSEVNRILSRIFPEASINFRVSEGGKGVELHIYINNILRDRLTLSGGEKTLVGFAIRLGISSLVSHLHSSGTTPDFIIIDEGFGPLDEENKNLIAEMLGSLIEEEMYSQVIVISHETELKNHPVFKSIVDVTKEKGYSRLKIRV